MVNKKGFTLIELLGIFALLGIIALVAFPYTTGMLKNTKKSEMERFKKNIFLATEAYIETNDDDYAQLAFIGGTEFIKVSELIAAGFLNENLVDPSTNEKIDENKSVKVSKPDSDKELAYELMDEDYSMNAYASNGLIGHYDAYTAPVNINADEAQLKDFLGSENVDFHGYNSYSWNGSEITLKSTEDYIDLGNAELSLSNGFTAEIRVKINDPFKTAALINNTEGAGFDILYQHNNDSGKRTIDVGYYDGPSYKYYNASLINQTDYNTVTLACGTAGEYCLLYINGEPQIRQPLINGVSKSKNSITVGATFTEGKIIPEWKGDISIKRVALYSRALTEEEIKKNYEIDEVRYGQ